MLTGRKLSGVAAVPANCCDLSIYVSIYIYTCVCIYIYTYIYIYK